MKASVLIPSWRRPDLLRQCLAALARQTRPTDEVFVVWQADDRATADAAETAPEKPAGLRVLHSPDAGVVPAENLALAASSGDIVLLLDDDALAAPTWLAQHLAHYDDPKVGAVGGAADNYYPDGTGYGVRAFEPIGQLAWYGRAVGRMHDQPPAWRTRPPIEVDHLVGYNLSLRRAAFDRFEAGLRRYWQLFELDACLQVKQRGYRVLFDYANVVRHYPTNTAYAPGREGDLTVKVDNAAFNHAFVLAKHSGLGLSLVRLAYLLAVGSTSNPGLAAVPIAWRRHGRLGRELSILARCWRHHCAGWRAGRQARP